MSRDYKLTTSEELMQFFDLGTVRPTVVPECHDFPHGRYYRADWPQLGSIWKPSVSTICSIIDPGIGIKQAIGNAHGWDAWADMMNQKAEDGTLVHELCVKMITGEIISTLELPERIIKRLLSFRQFCMQNKPKVLAAEMPLIHPDIPWAGRVDLILEVNGENWLVDIKTGAEWETYPIQLEAYRILAEKTLGIFINKTFDLYLKEWRGDKVPGLEDKPKYNLKLFGTGKLPPTQKQVYDVYSTWKMLRYKEPELPTQWPKAIALPQFEAEEEEPMSECCGAPLIGSDTDPICSECREHV